MSVSQPVSHSSSHDADIAVVERPLASETKGSINLRIETHTRQLIDDAAAVLGKTRTAFMIDSARALAIDVLLDQRHLQWIHLAMRHFFMRLITRRRQDPGCVACYGEFRHGENRI